MSLISGAAGAAGKKAAGAAAKAGTAKAGSSALGKSGVRSISKTAGSKAASGVKGGPARAPQLTGSQSGSGFGRDAFQAAAGPASGTDEGGAKAAALDLGKSIVKDAALEAAKGAVAGGGAGALAGAAKGAVTGALKNKTGRKVIVIWVSVCVATALIIPTAFAVVSSQIIAAAAQAFAASNNDSSVAAATASGLTKKQITDAMSLVAGSGIPWQIAASVKSEANKNLNVKAAVASLDKLDRDHAYRDIAAGALYSSGSNDRKVEGKSSLAAAAKVKAVYVAMITDVVDVEKPIASTIYDKAVGWSLAQTIPSCGTSLDSSSGPGATAGKVSLNPQQVTNAETIMGVAKSVWKDDVDQRKGAIVGIATAMQESTLRNISYGDRDSVGLFQQRPSQGLGTNQQIMNPVYSSAKFLTRLAGVKGWQSMPVAVAAQTVQGSAFPDAYAKWESVATGVVTQKFDSAFARPIPASVGFKGGAASSGSDASGATAPGDDSSLCLNQPVIGGGDVQKPIYPFHPTSPFGPRGDIGVGSNSFHSGQDLAAACDTPIYAVEAGTVVGSGRLGTYGNRVMIDHGHLFDTLYAHMPDGGPLVKVGDTVVAGQQIGRVGKTGAATGCHLHFETWVNSARVDPVPYMKGLGVDILTPSPDPHLTAGQKMGAP